jgi:hypothetical protein
MNAGKRAPQMTILLVALFVNLKCWYTFSLCPISFPFLFYCPEGWMTYHLTPSFNSWVDLILVLLFTK